jgi:hypothetical protein
MALCKFAGCVSRYLKYPPWGNVAQGIILTDPYSMTQKFFQQMRATVSLEEFPWYFCGNNP